MRHKWGSVSLGSAIMSGRQMLCFSVLKYSAKAMLTTGDGQGYVVADLLWFFQVENGYTLLVPIFKQFHKNIIGKGGANIKKVRKPKYGLNFLLIKGSVLNLKWSNLFFLIDFYF